MENPLNAARRLVLLSLLVVACEEGPIAPADDPPPDSVAAFLAKVGTALAYAESLYNGINANPAVASLLVLQGGITLGGQAPAALGGSTFSFYPEYSTYGRDPSLTGAPANTVRFILYRTEFYQRVVQPLQPTGYIDLVNEPGLDTVFTVRAVADGTPQADLRVDGFIRRDTSGSFRDSTRLRISGTIFLGAAAVPLSSQTTLLPSGSALSSARFEYNVELPRARVTGRTHNGLYHGLMEEGDGMVRIAVADGANTDSTVVEAVYRHGRQCSGSGAGFIRLNGDSVAAVTTFGFLVYGDTVTSDVLRAFWNVLGNCGILAGNIRLGVDALVAPASFALRELATRHGDLRITVTTSGTGTDPDGYVVVTPARGTAPFRWLRLSTNATVTMTGLPAGRRTVSLTELAPNCRPDGTNFGVATVPVNGGTDVAFSVICGDAPARSGLLLLTRRNGLYAHNLFTVDANGGNLTELAADVDSAEVAWSPDGTRIAFLRRVRGDTLEAAVIDGSEIKPLGSRPGRDVEVRWSADGTRLAVTNIPAGQNWTDIFVVTADGGTSFNITQSPLGPERSPAWAPDGSRIAFLSQGSSSEGNNVYAVRLDGSDLVKLTHFPYPGARAHLAWSPDGGRLLFRKGLPYPISLPSEVFVMNADGTGLQNLTQAQCTGTTFIECFPRDDAPRWSPDGTRIVFERFSNWNETRPNIYLMNADGTNQRRLTTDTGAAPEWAPDGSLVAFVGPVGLTFADTLGAWNMSLFGINPVQIRWQPPQGR